MSPNPKSSLRRLREPFPWTFGLLLGLCVWAYGPALAVMWGKWVNDPQYSHGYLVPAFAAVLLWLRRGCLPETVSGYSGLGLLLLLGGGLVRLAAGFLYVDWLEAFSLVVCVGGLFALHGGKPVLRWAWPAVAFLVFMIPLPTRVETALSQPLRRVATVASLYIMQTAGLPAVAEGNTIILSHGRIGIVEACSGLSMLLIFFALATAVAQLTRRPALDRVVLLVSAVPIAVLANVGRITVTGIAQELIDPAFAHRLFHDWGGWLMMPLALGMLWTVLLVLDRLYAARPEVPAAAVAVPRPVAGAPRTKTRAARV